MNNFIPRRYNYTLETGVVGTDDENIANILYNINRMEMKASFLSETRGDMQDALGDVFFMITDSKVHLNRFIKEFSEKLNPDTTAAVTTAVDNALETVRAAETPDSDPNDLHSAMLSAYKKLSAVIPFLQALDDQAVGKV